MKKRLWMLFLVVMFLCPFFVKDVQAWTETEGDWTVRYTTYENGSGMEIIKYHGNAASVTIPTKVGAHKVIGVHRQTFWDNDTIKTITVPDGMRVNGFGGCNVEKVYFQGNARLGEDTFNGCKYLKEVNLPKNLTEITSEMFRGCTSLISLTLPEGITKIGGKAFYGCTNLQKLKIPKNVCEIEYNPFAYCSSLKDLTVDSANPYFDHGPNGELYYVDGTHAELIFAGAVSGDYVVSKKADEVNQLAFAGATDLTSVTITSYTKKLVMDAFEGCEKLKKVVFEDACSAYGVYISYPNITFYYPAKYPVYYEDIQDCYDAVAYGKPKFKTQPKEARANAGETATFSVKVDVTNATYRWEVSKDNGETWLKTGESGYKTKQLKVKATDAKFGRLYRCVATDKYSGESSVSNAAKLVEDKVYANILKQPANTYAKLGENVKTKITAEGDGLTYEWYVKDPNKDSFVKSSIKTNTYSYKMTEAKDGRQVYCVITDKYGNSETSRTTTLRAAVTITEEPSDVVIAVGKTVKTTLKVYGKGLTYQWYVKNPGKTSFGKSSVTSSTYSCKMSAANDGRQVYCVVTDKYGNKTQSQTVELSAAASIIAQPVDVTVENGTLAKVKVSAIGTGLTYQWYLKGPKGESFTESSIKTATYSCKMSALKDGRQVYCVVTDSYGNSVQSDTVVLRIK